MGFIGPVGEPGIAGEKVRLLAMKSLLSFLQDREAGVGKGLWRFKL